MTSGHLFFLFAASLAAGLLAGPRFPRLWLALTLTGSLAGLGAAARVLLGGGDWEWKSEYTVGGQMLHLRLDGLSAVFVVLLCVVGGLGALYSREYWSDREHPRSAPRGRCWWSSLMLWMGCVFTASNGLHFLIAWELFTVSAYFLITLERERRDSQAQGWLYLAASHTGTLALFAFFAALSVKTGSWDLGPMRDDARLAPLFWLVLWGFGVKAGLFPLHVWLPSVHASSPSHVSAILSGVAIKVGVYGLLRFSGWLPLPAQAAWVVLGLGAVSALAGIGFAFVQNDLKRLLAYCSVENIGVILLALGGALLARQRGDAVAGGLLLTAALLHVWNHAAFKALLFFGAGSVLHATGTREMSRLGGLWRNMPVTTAFFALAALAASGLPPLNGFVSEWLLYLGLIGSLKGAGTAFWVLLPAVLSLAIAGALALASFAKANATVFLGAPRTQAAVQAHESRPGMLGPMAAMAVVCVLLGFTPGLLWPLLARAVASWWPGWGGGAAPDFLPSLCLAQVCIAGVAAAVAAGVWIRCRSGGLRRGLTWDCGYSAPSARMQYTSGSFAGVSARWLSMLLRPRLRLLRPRGAMPEKALRIERFPETVLERVIRPAGRSILWLSGIVRRLQHGRLQTYILYLVGGLCALALLVFMGAMQ